MSRKYVPNEWRNTSEYKFFKALVGKRIVRLRADPTWFDLNDFIVEFDDGTAVRFTEKVYDFGDSSEIRVKEEKVGNTELPVVATFRPEREK